MPTDLDLPFFDEDDDDDDPDDPDDPDVALGSGGSSSVTMKASTLTKPISPSYMPGNNSTLCVVFGKSITLQRT